MELRNRAIDLVDVLGRAALPLVERIHDATGWAERFQLLDDALLARLAGGSGGIAAEVTEAWRVILASDGTVPVASIAMHVGWGRRHLGERFRMATGLTPKEAARVARFEAAQRLLRAQDLPLAEIAVRCGYADQPHLAREWRALTGDNITTWVRDELPFVQDSRLVERAPL